jgi:hypothetical protein
MHFNSQVRHHVDAKSKFVRSVCADKYLSLGNSALDVSIQLWWHTRTVNSRAPAWCRWTPPSCIFCSARPHHNRFIHICNACLQKLHCH